MRSYTYEELSEIRKELQAENAELKRKVEQQAKQIEKMKCCCNCRNSNNCIDLKCSRNTLKSWQWDGGNCE